MATEIPSYEEYKKATKFARFRYRFGVVIMFLTWLSFLFVIFYMVSNGEAIASNPLIYGAEKYEATCTCIDIDGDKFYVNATHLLLGEQNFPDLNLEDINFSGINITN